MTDEEVTRFALVLSEADRVRAQIAEDETAARTADGGDLLPVAALLAVAPLSEHAAVTAA